LPELVGTSIDGRDVHTSGFHGRKNLVLVFSGEQSNHRSQELICELAGRYSEVQNETSEIVAVISGSLSEVVRMECNRNLPFPVPANRNGALHRKFGAADFNGKPLAIVCIADRFGEIYFTELCGDETCPSTDDILDWLRFIEIQCPECGVPEWPRF
jgi:peroxiredoxin